MTDAQLRTIRKEPHNQYCFDCHAKNTNYVNITIGTFVCDFCAGILRSMNHRIKSVTMSTFTPDEVKSLQQNGGNAKAKKIWLGKFDDGAVKKPKAGDAVEMRNFLRSKYLEKLWYKAAVKKVTKKPSSSEEEEEESEEEEEEEESEEETEEESPKKPVKKPVQTSAVKKPVQNSTVKNSVQKQSTAQAQKQAPSQKPNPAKSVPVSKKPNVKEEKSSQTQAKESKGKQKTITKRNSIENAPDLLDLTLSQPVPVVNQPKKSDLLVEDALSFKDLTISQPPQTIPQLQQATHQQVPAANKQQLPQFPPMPMNFPNQSQVAMQPPVQNFYPPNPGFYPPPPMQNGMPQMPGYPPYPYPPQYGYPQPHFQPSYPPAQHFPYPPFGQTPQPQAYNPSNALASAVPNAQIPNFMNAASVQPAEEKQKKGKLDWSKYNLGSASADTTETSWAIAVAEIDPMEVKLASGNIDTVVETGDPFDGVRVSSPVLPNFNAVPQRYGGFPQQQLQQAQVENAISSSGGHQVPAYFSPMMMYENQANSSAMHFPQQQQAHPSFNTQGQVPLFNTPMYSAPQENMPVQNQAAIPAQDKSQFSQWQPIANPSAQNRDTAFAVPQTQAPLSIPQNPRTPSSQDGFMFGVPIVSSSTPVARNMPQNLTPQSVPFGAPFSNGLTPSQPEFTISSASPNSLDLINRAGFEFKEPVSISDVRPRSSGLAASTNNMNQGSALEFGYDVSTPTGSSSLFDTDVSFGANHNPYANPYATPKSQDNVQPQQANAYSSQATFDNRVQESYKSQAIDSQTNYSSSGYQPERGLTSRMSTEKKMLPRFSTNIRAASPDFSHSNFEEDHGNSNDPFGDSHNPFA